MDTKYIVLVGDGMGDYPVDRLKGRTPLEAAETPNMDRLARIGQLGLVRTVPEGMEPGSDVANMSLLGYDPGVYHTGRAPLEAASMGVSLEPDELAFRCNLVFLERGPSGATVMGDYSAGHISTGEAEQIVASLQGAVRGTPLKLYPGVSYRHLLVWKGGPAGLPTTPPHDILGREVAEYDLTSDEPTLGSFVRHAAGILKDHPVNREREKAGKSPANAVWLWGQGNAPSMPTLMERFGLSGAMVSAVDLLRGIGVYAGLNPVKVEGATGYLDTNYEGKVGAALDALTEGNFVFLHLEAPDEASHEGNLEKKIEAIAKFDKLIVGPTIDGLQRFGDVRVLVVTDHMTPLVKRTHVSDPVPFLFVESLRNKPVSGSGQSRFTEKGGQAAGLFFNSGVELFTHFIGSEAGRVGHL
ncbi:MAG: cofactor-independent phosphoglycerate mutase [Syntrophobacteraceae bacterium]